MLPTSILLIIAGLALAMFGVKYFRRKDMAKGIGFVIAGIGVLAYMGYVSLTPLSAQLGLDTSGPATTSGSSGTTSLSGGVLPVDTLSVVGQEAGSNSYSQVDGIVKFYDTAANPKDPNTNPVESVQVNNGQGSSTNGKVRINTPYRVIYVNDTSNKVWYSRDLGIITPVPDANYNRQTGKATFFLEGPTALKLTASIADSIDETTNASANINGGNHSSVGDCTTETKIMFTNATQKLWYAQSVGSGSFYFDPLISVTGGANKVLQNLVLQQQWDLTNPPSGNEVTACSLSLLNGQNPSLPSDCLSAWKNQAKISLFNGADVPSGTLSRIRVSYTVDESAWSNGNELWNVVIADLGGRNEQDIGLGTGATDQVIQVGSCA